MIKNLSISQKLMLMVVSTVATALLFTTLSLSYFEKKRQQRALITEFATLGGIMAARSRAAVMFGDKKTADENLQALVSISNIDFACIYNESTQKPLARVSFSNNTYLCNTQPFELGVSLNPSNIVAHIPVTNNKIRIGNLLIIGNLHQLQDNLTDMRWIILLSSLVSGLLALLISTPLRRLIYLPVMQLSATARSITKDKNWSLRAERLTRDEMGEMVDAFNNMLSILQQDQEELEDMAYQDMLTGIPNRRKFREVLARAIAHSRTYKRQYGLIFIDLDNFKWVNDTLGHDMGDKLLITLAQRFGTLMHKTDSLCRIGGDEFTVVVDGIKTEADVETIAKKLLASLKQPIDLAGTSYTASTSLGIAISDGFKDDIASILRKSDLAVYQSKAAGKNTYRFYREPN